MLVSVLLVALTFSGIATHRVGGGLEPRLAHGHPAYARDRPVLVAHRGSLVPVGPPPGRRIALTFDDGPDARWTPRIAAVLRRYHVPATFFVVGSRAAANPGIVRMLLRDGHEIGNHTFTHAGLVGGQTWLRHVQLQLTQAVVAGITGHYTRLLRPPYIGAANELTAADAHALAHIAGRRYVVVLSTFDGRDWQRPGVDTIVEHSTPRDGRGGIVLLHDGGGDREQTVAALERLIPSLRGRGFRFVPVSSLTGLSRSALTPQASTWETARGRAFEWSARLAFTLTDLIALVVVGMGILLAARAVLLVGFAAHHRRATRDRGDDTYEPFVSVIVPAYNEAVGIERAVRSLASSNYPSFEVVVVDDGSTDGTGDIVEGIGSECVRLVRKANGGKSTALNAGIAESRGEILVMVDGDTVFEPETLRRLVRPFADERVGAVSGNTKVGNRRRLLGRWQHIEYVSGFNLDRRMYEVLQCTPTVPGAAGAFRRDALADVGGLSSATLAEDTDLTLAIGRTGRRVVYVDDALAWTEAPSTLGALWRQRFRWSYGTMQALWKHKAAMLARDPRQRRIGRIAVPYIALFQVALPLAAPAIDLYAVYAIVFADPLPVVGWWLAFTALQAVLAIYAFRLDREPMAPLLALPLQQFVYRQLMYLVVIESTVSALVGVRARWQHIGRTGDVEVRTVP